MHKIGEDANRFNGWLIPRQATQRHLQTAVARGPVPHNLS